MRGRQGKGLTLPAAQDLVAWEVKYVHNKLRNGITSNPEEYCLAIFDQEKTVTLETFRGQRKGRRRVIPCSPTVPGLHRNPPRQLYQGISQEEGTHLRRHIMQRIERRVNVRDQQLTRQRRQQRLSIKHEYPEGSGHSDTNPNLSQKKTPSAQAHTHDQPKHLHSSATQAPTPATSSYYPKSPTAHIRTRSTTSHTSLIRPKQIHQPLILLTPSHPPTYSSNSSPQPYSPTAQQ